MATNTFSHWSPIVLACLIVAGGVGAIFFILFLPHDNLSSKGNAQEATVPLSSETSSTHSLAPVISNQWYSNIFYNFPTYPLYAMPLAYKVTPSGLGFSYPAIKRTKNTIFAPYTEDFTVGFSDEFEKPEVTDVGDWTIEATLRTGKKDSLSFTIGHGLPYAIIHSTNSSLDVTFPHDFSITSHNAQVTKSTTTNVFLLVANGNNYLFTFPKEVTVTVDKKALHITGVEKVVVALLDKKEHADLFTSLSSLEIQDSQVNPQVTTDALSVTYQLITTGATPLLTLYPHQYDSLNGKIDALGSYQTIRGELQLVKTSEFTMRLPLVMPNGTLTKLTKDYPDLPKQIKKDIADFMKGKRPDGNDYYLGTWFGKASNLLVLADAYGLDDDKHKLLQFIEPIFIESLDGFYYDKQKTSMIARKPEFGNDDLNDHHFHYGYYIRTAAVISSFDLSFLQKVKKQVDNLTSDISTTERVSTDYPFLRNFDLYEGHSWADGDGATNDGNNQESSSEAINAWYGVYLWGKVNNDMNIQKYALLLYNMEIQSAKYYWFDVKNMYKAPYDHAVATIIWGGKVDFATWFSDKTNMKYGIELLPITPGSVYLGGLPDFQKYASDYHNNSGSEKDSWGDLFLLWQSFYSPDKSLVLKDSATKPEDNSTRSMLLYFLYSNKLTVIPSLSPIPSK